MDGLFMYVECRDCEASTKVCVTLSAEGHVALADYPLIMAEGWHDVGTAALCPACTVEEDE